MKSERGQIIIGCALAVVLICGWLVLLGFAMLGLIRGIQIESELNNPPKMTLYHEAIPESSVMINIACPSKIIPSQKYICSVWSESSEESMIDALVLVSIQKANSMIVDHSGVEVITSGNTEIIPEKSVKKFEFGLLNLELKEPTIDFVFSAALKGKSTESALIAFHVPVDSNIVRDKIIADRTWQLIVIGISILLPILLALL